MLTHALPAGVTVLPGSYRLHTAMRPAQSQGSHPFGDKVTISGELDFNPKKAEAPTLRIVHKEENVSDRTAPVAEFVPVTLEMTPESSGVNAAKIVPNADPQTIRVIEKTFEILRGNRVSVTAPNGEHHTFTTPSNCTGEQDSRLDYGGKQWLWDSAAHAMCLAHTEPEVAKSEIRAMMANQNLDTASKDFGFIPHMNYFHGDGQKVPDWATRHFQAYLDSPEGENVPATARADFLKTYWSSPVHSDITQPPILGMAALEVYEATGDKEFLREVTPKLAAYHDYLHRRRGDENGLLTLIHSWESGWDNSQRWDEAYGIEPGPDGTVKREEIDDKKMRLFSRYKSLGWDLDKIKESGDFSVKAVDFTALHAKNMQCLSVMFKEMGDDHNARKYADRAEQVSQAIFEHMWDGEKYCDLVTRDGEEYHSTVKSAAMFYPMMLAGEPHGKELVGNHLANPLEFNPEDGYSVPTTAMDDATLDKNQYWRGNIWMIVNFFTHCGVKQHLKEQPGDLLAQGMAGKVRNSGYDCLDREDFFEYFNPDQAQPTGHGVPSFGWNGLVMFMDKTPAFMKL